MMMMIKKLQKKKKKKKRNLSIFLDSLLVTKHVGM
jgi:hypothetical protein